MLLDTSGLLCYFDNREARHGAAVVLYHAAARPRVTHSYVLDEFVALATARRLPRPTILTCANAILDDPTIEVVWVDETLHRSALVLLGARPDKTYSLCDAVSFVLLRARGLTDALTTDHHFEQEGFTRLL